MVQSEPTDHQKLAEVKRITGLTMQLRPFERVVKIKIEATEIVVLIETFRYAETVREVTISNRGRKLVGFKKVFVTGAAGAVLGGYWDRSDVEKGGASCRER